MVNPPVMTLEATKPAQANVHAAATAPIRDNPARLPNR